MYIEMGIVEMDSNRLVVAHANFEHSLKLHEQVKIEMSLVLG